MIDLEEIYIDLWPRKTLAKLYWKELRGWYKDETRHYHTLQHLEECLSEPEVRALDPEIHTALKLAVFYHDAVMSFGTEKSQLEDMGIKYSNEEMSAMLLIEHAQEQGYELLDPVLNMAVRMIEETENHSQPGPPLDPETDLMLDIDLAILGRDQERFDEYEAQIRTEYAHIPDSLFFPARAAILERFLALDQIYRTTSVKSRYEDKARANLQRSLESIRSR